MALTKQVVCLARSRKMSGLCVAGREFDSEIIGSWIRPVSNRPHEEVSPLEARYDDGSQAQLLDIIEMSLGEPKPNPVQPENWLLDTERPWRRAGQIDLSDLPAFTEGATPLWMNGSSSGDGQNDRVPEDLAPEMGSSLRLIHVDAVEFSVSAPSQNFGDPERKVRGHFSFAGDEYALRVTDLAIEARITPLEDGRYPGGPCFLTISLAEPWKGFCYKLIAAVIEG